MFEPNSTSSSMIIRWEGQSLFFIMKLVWYENQRDKSRGFALFGPMAALSNQILESLLRHNPPLPMTHFPLQENIDKYVRRIESPRILIGKLRSTNSIPSAARWNSEGDATSTIWQYFFLCYCKYIYIFRAFSMWLTPSLGFLIAAVKTAAATYRARVAACQHQEGKVAGGLWLCSVNR